MRPQGPNISKLLDGYFIVGRLYLWFHSPEFKSTADWKYSQKTISRKFPKEQNLNLQYSGNCSHSIYIVLSVIKKLEMF